jgi:hypothetical protein
MSRPAEGGRTQVAVGRPVTDRDGADDRIGARCREASGGGVEDPVQA